MFLWHVVSEWRRKRSIDRMIHSVRDATPIKPLEFYGEREECGRLCLLGEDVVLYRQRAKVRMASGRISVMDYQWAEPENPETKHMRIDL